MSAFGGPNLTQAYEDYVQRVIDDGGTYAEIPAPEFQEDLLKLLALEPSVLLFPFASKTGTLYVITGSDFPVERNSTKYVLGPNGSLISYGNDLPSFEYNTDGTFKGLLVEPAATNLVTYSEQYNQTSWFKLRTTVTANDAVAPDGTTTADRVEITTTGAARCRVDFSGLTAGDNYTFSFFAKKATSGNQITVLLTNSGETLGSERTLNLDTLAVTVSGFQYPFTLTAESIGNGWVRVKCLVTILAGQTSIRFNCLPGNTSNPTTTGANAYFWGAQFETGTQATSYIPTAGSTVTRITDDIELNSASGSIGQTEGTIFYEMYHNIPTDQSIQLIHFNRSIVNAIVTRKNNSFNNSAAQIWNGGSLISVAAGGFQSENSPHKLSFAYKSGDSIIRLNNTTGSSTTSFSSFGTSLNNITIFKNVNFHAFPYPFHLKFLAIFKRRLTNTELENIHT